MQPLKFSSLALIGFSLFVAPARADILNGPETAEPRCQIALGTTAPTLVQRVSVPYVDQNQRLIALTSVIPDFDRERDVVVGIRPGRHTYLINAQIGRHDPKMFGGRDRLHFNDKIERLRVSPGLIIRLRLSAPEVRRLAEEMARRQGQRSLTCTNTTARVLARAGVAEIDPFIFTPVQLIRNFGGMENVDARVYLVNSDAESVEEFEDEVKVVGAKKKPKPPSPAGGPRGPSSGRRDDGDSCDCCTLACLDVNWFSGLSESGECSCGESSSCAESNSCEGSECGGSDSDSDCCN